MKKNTLYLLFFSILLNGCSSPESLAEPASPPPEVKVTSTPATEPTLVATVVPAIEPTLTPAQPLPDVHNAHLDEIHMMDESSGWAWAGDPAYYSYLLHTSDGGQTWLDVTPVKDTALVPYRQPYVQYASFFLDSQTAWVFIPDDKLIRTSDGGQTWQVINENVKDELVWPYRDWYRLRFANANHGWLDAGYTAAGAHEFYYETQDGGVTWKPLDFETWPGDLFNNSNYKNELAFWSVINVIYYDETKFIIAPGEQEGTLKIFISLDERKSWKTVELPSAIFSGMSFAPYNRRIQPPVFFDQQAGILPVTVWDENTKTVQVFFYGTSDDGLTWALMSGPTHIQQGDSEISYISLHEAAFICDVSLCVTKDGGNTWQTLDPGIPIPADKEHTSLQLNFINPSNGWLLIQTYDDQSIWLDSRLFRTTDGGVHWTELSPVINP